ncbi:response regulator [Neoroseomonas soli]|uniref:Response regulator n=1 Tax=Neoroseomonas soli TaxID=1081025 RepID=A0A9X9WVF4_9PROT|nr:response regulator [Neoroseomonas soli]MBR0671133.1 response regulator [Neoroseomonas soli]
MTPAPPGGFVLVVDDEPVVAAELAAGLADMGYATAHALGAARAMEILAARPEITVLVTDIRMPGTDGIALAHAATAGREAGRAISVVLITGHATPEELARAMPGGDAELVRKPFRLKEIGAAVERAHHRAAARRGAASAHDC